MKGIISPETILDHVVAYTIGAGEVMEESLKKKHNASKYNMAMVPFGPPFYTAILQAAGVLAIKKDSKTAILVYQQYKKSDSILLHNHDIGPILGKTFIFPTTLEKLSKAITQFTHFTQFTQFTDSIENQMYFIRVLSSIEELVIVGIGTEVEQKKVDAVLEYVRKALPDSTMFFVHNFSHEKEFSKCRKEDDVMITNIIKHKVKSIKDNSYQIPKIFSDYSKKLKRIPAVVAYTNTGDLGGNKQKTSGYACLIA
ncbi:MAG: hypothetical protein CO170_00440 [candidate division SR1 bacterium CG_4_9_14_3_um_filter_40_9]|nr:MAG: hypothetical protein CO170_00440 [candidate division SR1 bacterium CG_4_9_14_3_um_filter_40_9]